MSLDVDTGTTHKIFNKLLEYIRFCIACTWCNWKLCAFMRMWIQFVIDSLIQAVYGDIAITNYISGGVGLYLFSIKMRMKEGMPFEF